MDMWICPYVDQKTTKRFTYKKPGVYLIRNKQTQQITYIGMSTTNVYKALYRHFQKWNDCPQRVVYLNREYYEVKTIVCQNKDEAIKLEKRLIKWFYPSDNREFYEDDFDFTEIPDYLKLEVEICPF